MDTKSVTFKLLPTKRSAVASLIAFLLLPSLASAGWVYIPDSTIANTPATGSVLIRTYAIDAGGATVPVYSNPVVSDVDGSGVHIEANGAVVQLSAVTPYPVLTSDMTGYQSTPADQWMQLFDPVIAGQMFSFAFLLIAISGAAASAVGTLISMFGRK